MASMSAALKPRTKAPTSVSARRLSLPQRRGVLPGYRDPSGCHSGKQCRSAKPGPAPPPPLAGQRHDRDPKSQGRSRSGVPAGGIPPVGSCAERVTGRGSHSSVNCSTATMPAPAAPEAIGVPAGREPELRPTRAVEPEGIAPSRPDGGQLDRDGHRVRPSALEDEGAPLLHHRPDRMGHPGRGIGAAKQPRGGGRHPGPVRLFAGAAAKAPSPEAIHRHQHLPKAGRVAPHHRRPAHPPPIELCREADPIAGPGGQGRQGHASGGKLSIGRPTKAPLTGDAPPGARYQSPAAGALEARVAGKSQRPLTRSRRIGSGTSPTVTRRSARAAACSTSVADTWARSPIRRHWPPSRPK